MLESTIFKKLFMRRLLQSCALLLLTAFAPIASQAQSPTHPALGFNVFLENGARLVNNETEGPVALGGNLTVDGGYQVSTNNPGSFYVDGVRVTLVIGGKVLYQSGTLQVNQNGYVKIGDCLGSTVWYTDPNGAYPPIRITPNSNYNALPRIMLQASANTLGVSASVKPVCQANVIDFTTAFTILRANAINLKNLADNATITNSGGTPIPHTGLPSQVKINLNPGANVLNISGTDLNAMNELTFVNSPNSSRYLIVNVNAPGAFTWNVHNSAGIGPSVCKYILYNFYNTTALSVAGYGAVAGTLFAPNADILKTANMANIDGQIIAKSYHHAGGENHYYLFEPSVPGCDTAIAPDANFNINLVNQCLACNNFAFYNASTGTAPLSYLWTFGDGTTSTLANPTKVYSTTGTFSVKLKVTGPSSSDSITRSVVVSPHPVHGFTINDTLQELTGNSFVFTSTTPTTGNVYSWNFSDGNTSTVVNPTHTFTAPGIYVITQSVKNSYACYMETVKTVVVESDGVGSGGGGGLESESMGDLISKRDYNRIKNSVTTKIDYSTLPVFSKPGPLAAAKTTNVGSTLERYIPATLDAATVPKITTPSDLTTITTAVDAFSVDYTKNDVSKAVVLAITTTGKPYNHTKSICDRFRGATLIGTKKIKINGYDFVEFALKQADGHVEHSIAFAASKTVGRNTFKLQSKWLISEYSTDDSIFNFQVWSTNPDNTKKLATEILNTLAGIMPLQQADNNFILPQAFLSYGTRNKELLNINITSVRASNNAKVIFIRKINEEAAEDSLIIPFNIAAGETNQFSIPIYDGYEYEGHFYMDDTLTDDVYMADGGWSLDYDKTYTEIQNFKPNNNDNRIYRDDEFPLYRSVRVTAKTTDYISIYKFVKGGHAPADLSAYKSYKLYAKGTGKMTIRMIKESVVRFADQYKTTIPLTAVGSNYQISFDDFTSDFIKAPFDPKDVKAVVYTFELNGVNTEFDFFADDQSFSPTAVQSIKALQSKEITVSPNPTTGAVQLKFVSDEARDMDVTFTDMTGKLVFKQSVRAIVGFNTVNIDFPKALPTSVLLVQMGNNNVKYGVTKLSIMK
jgi:choice-of-anchor A domain-containing protein